MGLLEREELRVVFAQLLGNQPIRGDATVTVNN
jgi:hypothetical protein